AGLTPPYIQSRPAPGRESPLRDTAKRLRFSNSGTARVACAAILVAVLCGCAISRRYDMVRIHEASAARPERHPVIVLHGLMGSKLRNERTHESVWGRLIDAITVSPHDDLALPIDDPTLDGNRDALVPYALYEHALGVKFYGAMIDALRDVGGYRIGAATRTEHPHHEGAARRARPQVRHRRSFDGRDGGAVLPDVRHRGRGLRRTLARSDLGRRQGHLPPGAGRDAASRFDGRLPPAPPGDGAHHGDRSGLHHAVALPAPAGPRGIALRRSRGSAGRSRSLRRLDLGAPGMVGLRAGRGARRPACRGRGE